MPEPTKIPRPFADSGDKNSIPDSSGGIGFASWQEGFPAITGTPFAQGGVAPKRADFNGIFNALSLATVWQQQGGFYAYDATTDYEIGNVVEYNNDLYKCLTANGPSSAVKAPTDTTVWSKVMTAADAASLYLPLSGGTLTGVTNAPTPATTDNSTKIATTSFVNDFAGNKIVRYWQLNTNESMTFNMVGDSAVVIAKRNLYSAVLVFDGWNSAPVFVAEQLGSSPRPITGSQTSGKITVTNNGGYGSLKLIILAGEKV